MHEDQLLELMEKMYSEIKNGMQSMDRSLHDISARIGSLEASQTGFENELEDAKKTLYDAFIQNAEAIRRLDEKIQDLSDKVEQHAIKIQVIEGGKRAL